MNCCRIKVDERFNWALSEEYQDLECKFAWAIRTGDYSLDKRTKIPQYTTLSQWMICKDFLHDHLWAIHHGTDYSIHGYKASYKTLDNRELDSSELVLCVWWPNQSSSTMMSAFGRTLNVLEKLCPDMDETMYQRDVNQTGTLALTVDDLWKSTTWACSLLTLILRDARLAKSGGNCLEVFEAVGKLGMSDSSIWRGIHKIGLEFVMENFKQLTAGGMLGKEDITEDDIHHTSGVYSVFSRIASGCPRDKGEQLFMEYYEEAIRTKGKKGSSRGRKESRKSV